MTETVRKIMKMLVLLALLGGCSIIFEEDISEEIIYIIMPADGTSTVNQDQLFWWESINDVIKYNLQIVEGDFSAPQSFVADTNMPGNKFQINLPPGDYEWRILGWNNYSETDFFYSKLIIEDTPNLK